MIPDKIPEPKIKILVNMPYRIPNIPDSMYSPKLDPRSMLTKRVEQGLALAAVREALVRLKYDVRN